MDKEEHERSFEATPRKQNDPETNRRDSNVPNIDECADSTHRMHEIVLILFVIYVKMKFG